MLEKLVVKLFIRVLELEIMVLDVVDRAYARLRSFAFKFWPQLYCTVECLLV